jgi:para-nitrobenzyl esterase
MHRAARAALLTVIVCGLLSVTGAPGAARRTAAVRVAAPRLVLQRACTTATANPPGVITTQYGAVSGTMESGVYAYKGIPYAAPPVGALRWRDPLPPDCWPDVRDASSFGSRCPQLSDGAVVGDEDCLTLNVWTPDPTAANGSMPVMLFIHGGGNVQGSASDTLRDGSYLYDGAVLARNGGAVVVTINYRLGVFGFLAHPALSTEPGQTNHGNYGLADQIAALTWVQQNVAAFGGDPARVLIFGESGGARDVCALVASPRAAGLFSRALMESETCDAAPLARHEAAGETLAQTAGCADAADVPGCLRALPAQALVAALPVNVADSLNSLSPLPYGPTVDGLLLPDVPLNVIRSGGANPVPLIVGSNADEMSLFAPRTVSAGQYESMVRRAFPRLADKVLAQYPIDAYPSGRAAWVALTSDALFICPARGIARAAAAGLQAPVYRYLFTHTLSGAAGQALGAFHGLELRWVFGGITAGGYRPTAAEQALSDAIIGYWSRFAATGDPNGAGAVVWPAYDPATDSYLGLDETIVAGHGVHTANCDFWNSLAPS